MNWSFIHWFFGHSWPSRIFIHLWPHIRFFIVVASCNGLRNKFMRFLFSLLIVTSVQLDRPHSYFSFCSSFLAIIRNFYIVWIDSTTNLVSNTAIVTTHKWTSPMPSIFPSKNCSCAAHLFRNSYDNCKGGLTIRGTVGSWNPRSRNDNFDLDGYCGRSSYKKCED